MTNSRSNGSNTGYRGVHFERSSGKFRARLTIGKVLFKHLGMFNTVKEAVTAREEYIKSLF